jgi:phosphatidylserine synthase
MIATSFYLSTKDAPLPAEWVAVLTVLVALSMVSPLRYPAFKGLRGVEVAVMAILALLLLYGTTVWGTPRIVFATFGSFALLWGYWWVPLRPYLVPGVTAED